MSRTFLGIAIELWERLKKKKTGLVREKLNFDRLR